jgi:glycosyltransferase involved in cell wall biosynthesis
MKLITFVIPAYNSESYLHHAVDSLIQAGDDIEIIIVNDGSNDQTLAIAKRYQENFPSIVSVIDKENGGHGSAINAGLKQAKGLFFKVIDSDDWVDETSLFELIATLKKHQQDQTLIDVYITNFVYEHVSDDTQYVRNYEENFPVNQVFDWNQVKKKFKYSKTLMMHAFIFRTAILHDIHLELPHHTFYVDNLFSYIPLPFTNKLYYMNLPFYRYFIGRSDQSITFKNITSRYLQQIRVQKLMIDAYSLELIHDLPKGLKHYMKHCLSAIMMITQMFTVASDTKERRTEMKNLWKHVKMKDRAMYRFLRYRSLNTGVNFLPWKLKSYVMVKGYFYLAKKIKLG